MSKELWEQIVRYSGKRKDYFKSREQWLKKREDLVKRMKNSADRGKKEACSKSTTMSLMIGKKPRGSNWITSPSGKFFTSF